MRNSKGQFVKIDPIKRFWSYVDKTSDPDGCWIWTGYCNPDGYGTFSPNQHAIFAHRFSWELHSNKKIPESMKILHKCDNPSCVNPDHLFIGTNKDNSHDMVKKNRQAMGEKVHTSKLITEQVLEIRKLYIPNIISSTNLAKKYGVSHNNILNIIKRKCWKHI